MKIVMKSVFLAAALFFTGYGIANDISSHDFMQAVMHFMKTGELLNQKKNEEVELVEKVTTEPEIQKDREPDRPARIKNMLGFSVVLRGYDENDNEIYVVNWDANETYELTTCASFALEVPLSFDDKTLFMRKHLNFSSLKPGVRYLMMGHPNKPLTILFVKDTNQN